VLPTWELMLRIFVGAVLGGIIGLERDIHGRPVGFRTYMIVAMTAATFMVISAHFIFFQKYPDGAPVEVDVSRIAASVVSGIGFLAGGAILKTGITIQGLTTAAALWLVTAIGMCAGSGMFILAVAVTAMGLLALGLLRLFEGKHASGYRRIICLELSGSSANLQRVLDQFVDSGIVFTEFDYSKAVAENKMEVTFEARVPRGVGIPDLIQKIEQDPNVRHIKVGFPK
jgi:putative Mg2+ transporter-C (MgtC) family protein